MREIKFRAWNWKKFFCFDFDDFYKLSIENNLESILDTKRLSMNTQSPILWMEVMQYTWLKDKIWKEIFEWDIVNYQLPNDNFWQYEKQQRKIGQIKYEPEWGWFVCEWEYSKNQHQEYIGCDNDMIILGNIYENPELLLK